VAANYSIDYLQKVRVELGAERADSMMRLHLVPGMLHCRGGSGVDHFGGSGDTQAIGDARHDVLSALVQWVEQGQVPKDINDSRIESGRVMRQRPLCPYPQQAAHRGGDINQADSCARAVVDEESQLR
jgi:feruloyl esterase